MMLSRLVLIFVVFALANCNKNPNTENIAKPKNDVTSDLINGQKLFTKNCAKCHGRGGKGSDQGPPLVHKIYEPSHHGDLSFYRAVESGVRAHHWQFGDMPPLKEVSKSDMSVIIHYVRHEQRKAGIK